MFSHPFPGRWLCSTPWPLFSYSHPHLLDRGQVEPQVGPLCVISLVGKSFTPAPVQMTLVRLFPSPQGPFCSFPTLLCAHEAVLIGWHLGAPGPWCPDGLVLGDASSGWGNREEEVLGVHRAGCLPQWHVPVPLSKGLSLTHATAPFLTLPAGLTSL